MPNLIQELQITIEGTMDVGKKLKLVDDAMEKLGMRLRLSGRDWMRLGGTANQFGNTLLGIFRKLIQGDTDLSWAFEDVSYAIQDISDAAGVVLIPLVEDLAGLLEMVAGVIEDNPWLGYLVLLLVVGGLFLLVVGRILTMIGTLNLLTGTIMTSKSAGLGLVDTLKLLVKSGGKSAEEIRLMAAEMKGLKMDGRLQTRMDQFADATADASKATTGIGGKFKSAAKSGLKWALGIGALVGGFFLLGPIMESLAPIFEAFQGAWDVIADAIEPVIQFIADFIEENPALIAAMFLAIVGAIIAMKATDFLGWLKGIFSGMQTAQTSIPTVTKSIGDLSKNILSLAAAIGILLISLAAAVWILSQTRFTLPEIIALIGTLVTSVIILTGTMLAFMVIVGAAGVTVAGLGPLLIFIVGILLAVGAAALLVGAGFLLAGIGIGIASAGIVSLLANLPALLVLAPLLLLLALGFGLLGIAGLIATPGILLFSASLLVLTAALLALMGVLLLFKAMGLEGIANAVAGGMAAAIPKVPALKEGGMVKTEGLAYLHPAEVVTPAKETRGNRVTNYNTFNINGTVRSNDDIERIASEVSKIQNRKYKNRSYS